MSRLNIQTQPMILCGAAGKRLWPASRESMQKHFGRLVNVKTSTFQASLERVADQAVFVRLTVIASAGARFIVAEQCGQLGIAADILFEPQGRDRAAAVAVAALHAAATDPQAVVLIMAAGHVTPDTWAFFGAVKAAAVGPRTGCTITLGIKPTHPASDYGYLRRGAAIAEAPGAARVGKIIEKPDRAGAEPLIAKCALWDLGYFLFRANLDFIRLDADAFAKAPKISIGYAVMERTARAGGLPVSFLRSDVGTWDAVWQVLDHDAAGSTVRGWMALVETKKTLLHSQGGGLTAMVGPEDVVVAPTPDAVLVASKGCPGEVKLQVDTLRASGEPEADAHLRMCRPWGWYHRIDLGERFQVTRIQAVPVGRLSPQKQYHKAEHWVVVRGTAEMTVDDRMVLVHENEAVYLPIGSMHRMNKPQDLARADRRLGRPLHRRGRHHSRGRYLRMLKHNFHITRSQKIHFGATT